MSIYSSEGYGIHANELKYLTSNNLLTSNNTLIWIFERLLMHHPTASCDGYFNYVTWSWSIHWCCVHGFEKAFDTVLHKHLLYKIEYYRITGNLLRWIAGFLSNRRQCVVLNEKQSGKMLRAAFLNDQS